MTPENAGAVAPPSEGMGEFSRIFGVFFEPKKTFEDIAQRPTWLVPMVLTIIFSLAFCIVVGQRIGWDTIAQQQIDKQIAKAPPEQRDAIQQRADISKKITPIIAYVGVVVGPPLLYLIVGLVLLGIVAGIMSAPVKFGQIFAIQSYAGMPGIIMAILMVVVVFLKQNPADFDIRHPLAFNAGAFMDPDTSNKFVYSLASAFDLFTIWRLLLIAVGLKAAAGKKLSFGGAFFAVFVPWLVFALIAAALAGVIGG